MQLTGTVVNWAIMWEVWSVAAIITGLGILTFWAVRGVWKLSKRKDV